MPDKKKYACPCCGFFTYTEEVGGTYFICPVCFWEDDPLQLSDPDYEGGANVVSLNQARKNFIALGAIEQRVVEFVRKPHDTELKA